jgi:hypothetical protein
MYATKKVFILKEYHVIRSVGIESHGIPIIIFCMAATEKIETVKISLGNYCIDHRIMVAIKKKQKILRVVVFYKKDSKNWYNSFVNFSFQLNVDIMSIHLYISGECFSVLLLFPFTKWV